MASVSAWYSVWRAVWRLVGEFTSIALLALASLALAQDAPDAGADAGAVAPAGEAAPAADAGGEAAPSSAPSASPAEGSTPSSTGDAGATGSTDVVVPSAAASGSDPSTTPPVEAGSGSGNPPDSGSATSTTAASGGDSGAAPSVGGDSSSADSSTASSTGTDTTGAIQTPAPVPPAGSPAAPPTATTTAAPQGPQGGVYSILPATSTGTAFGAGATHLISVARDNKLTFEPSSIRPRAGDIVRFNFLTGNHSIASANWELPCQANGVWTSAAHPMQYNNGVGYVDFHVVSQYPIWFFSTSGDECKQGMVFSMNPNDDNQVKSFSDRSKKFTGKKGKRSMRVRRQEAQW